LPFAGSPFSFSEKIFALKKYKLPLCKNLFPLPVFLLPPAENIFAQARNRFPFGAATRFLKAADEAALGELYFLKAAGDFLRAASLPVKAAIGSVKAATEFPKAEGEFLWAAAKFLRAEGEFPRAEGAFPLMGKGFRKWQAKGFMFHLPCASIKHSR